MASDEDEGDNESGVNVKSEVTLQKRWLSFYHSRLNIPLHKHLTPVKDDRSYPLYILLSAVKGVDSQAAGRDTRAQIHVSLFHQHTRRFFGNTWSSKSVKMPSKSTIILDTFVYTHSSIRDEQCVAVVEISLQHIDKLTGHVLRQHGGGWALIPLFSIKDFIASKTLENEYSVQLFTGTPRALSFAKPATLPVLPNSTLTYSLGTSSKLKPLLNVIRENELVGADTLILGGDPRWSNW